VIDAADAFERDPPDPQGLGLLLLGEVCPELPACLLLVHLRSLAFVFQCVQSALKNIECQSHTSAHMAKTSAISVRVSEQVKQAAEKAAEDDRRSLASYVEKLLVEHLKAKGYLKK
jgi:hypothetical protein